ncbi:MAG TPA: TonB family protein [Thermoanaerobaculia bacterium]|nr:TonB family protein [Thermoanaerobaculia bacterium]
MREEILVVEYEPRYTERVKQALSGQQLSPLFAKDGEEAMLALESGHPRLIVLSSVVPRVSTTELIRRIRSHSLHRDTPILLTMSGYTGQSPSSDAARIGASDILAKPYSEVEFLAKVRTILGLPGAAAPADEPETLIIPSPLRAARAPQPDEGDATLTSGDIFGEVLADQKTVPQPSRRASARMSSDDLDKMLADTLSGVRPTPARRKPAEASSPEPKPEPKSRGGMSDIDRLLEDTLSGLEKTVRMKVPSVEPPAAAQSAAPPPAAAPRSTAVPPPAPPPFEPSTAGKVSISSPVLPPEHAEPLMEKEDTAAESDGARFGQYVLLDRIATGGMAEVWKARMRGVEGFQKIVAIKKILPHLSDNEEFVTMFVDEAKLAAQLNHNNIIHIYDLGRIASSYYIAMEYIDGHDLKTILKKGEERGLPIPLELAIFIASKVAAALDYAHRRRDFNEKELELVHRDVSPQNVLISHEGDIKLCDFGIAKAASKASHTHAGSLKGKLQYMSPEQAWGRRIDRRSDLFALATVLFEMLAGRKLFSGENELSILDEVREARVVAPSSINDEVPPSVDAIVLKALEKEPDNRYQSAGEMARDLDAVLYGFRPTPTSADLAIYMHRLYSAEAAHFAPVSPLPAPFEDQDDGAFSIEPATVIQRPRPAIPHPAVSEQTIEEPFAIAPPQPAKKKRSLALVAVALVVVAGLATGGYLVMRPSEPAAQQTVAPRVAAAAPAAAPSAASDTSAAPMDVMDPAVAPLPQVGSALPPTDQARVDEEVRRRLDAERQRLEQQKTQILTADRARQQQAAPPETVAAAVPSVVPSATTREPEPPPPAVSTAQQAAAVPPPSEPARTTVREGELVEQGTEGLLPPEVIEQFRPPYPPLARSQRVEGVVIVSALISETGQVLETRILRGIPLLNDAALQAVRRSKFRPGTKDGVRVKAYKTMTVPFRL